MASDTAASRRAAGFAATILVTATLLRLLTLPLPTDRWSAELALGVAGAVYTVAVLRLMDQEWDRHGALIVAKSVIPALIAGAALELAKGYLDDFDVVATLLFVAVQLGVPAARRRWPVIAGTLLVDGVFAAVWRSSPSGDGTTLALVLVFMIGLQLALLAQRRGAGVNAETETRRRSARAITAERVGTAIDMVSVARAVLETSREAYPLTTHAAVMLLDPTVDRLRSLPVYLGPAGVVTVETDSLDVGLAPGEGLAGKVYRVNRPMLWSSAHEVHMAQYDLEEQPRSQLQALQRGVPLSAIGAPLTVDEEVIGAYVLTSHRQEMAWSEDDLPVVHALANEAARAVARARRYERDLVQAHLDSITGLANHRQLTRILDQELARARRLTSSLGVVFCDLDRFKTVNDTYGHAAGDRVLGILANVFQDSLRREDSAARYGGDEFVCVLPGADRAEADAVGRRVSTSFEARVREDAELALAGVTISCGVAIYPDDSSDADGLLEHADAAMRVVKTGRRASLRRTVRTA